MAITDYDFPLAKERAAFKVSPGLEYEYSLAATFCLNDWISLTPEFIYNYISHDDYQSSYPVSDQLYEFRSEKEVGFAKLSLELSSINSFLQKKFTIPGMLTMSGQKTIFGKNTPAYTRFDLELRLLF